MAEGAFWLAWSQIKGIGPILLLRLQRHFGTLAAAWHADAEALGQVEGFGPKTVAAVLGARKAIDPEKLAEAHLKDNPHFWTPADADYPRLLREIPNPPTLLYYRGVVRREENQGMTLAVAIVGTREPTDYGKRWARRISRTLAQKGFTIVSGMAQGIDSEAHRGCLEAGGRTIAVFGTGVDMIYPPRNQQLYEQILQQGLVVSEYPAGTQPDRAHFPQRNRIIVGLCRAVLIVEAPVNSGALISARLANDFGRDVYVLPGRLDDLKSQGCLGLLSKGAHLIISEGYLLEMLGAIPQLDAAPVSTKEQNAEQLELFAPASSSPTVPDLAPDLAKVLEAVPSEAILFDLIVEQAAMDASSVSSALLQLELLGLVSQLPGMRYQRS
ncbi:MAG: DNA-protecting protein DprA [Hormoscilla sp. GM7CHS1pb]|nr:DNA-protecting protein DprA [Hormoscilla sp. GM7CHS1pb]